MDGESPQPGAEDTTELLEPVSPQAADPAARPPARPWTSSKAEPPPLDPERQAQLANAIAEALGAVSDLRSKLPAWRRSLAAAGTAAAANPADWKTAQLLLATVTPKQAVAAFEQRDDAQSSGGGPSDFTASFLLGSHYSLLIGRLEEADTWVTAASAGAAASQPIKAAIAQADVALAGATQHVLFIMLLGEMRTRRVADSVALADYAADWGLTSAQVDELWTWLANDPLTLGGQEVPLALDTQNKAICRKATGPAIRGITAAMPLIAFVAVFLIVTGLFALLAWANVKAWPGNWVPKMIVLLLFITIGAIVHLGSHVINVNYDDPIKIIDAGGLIDWLSLRWVDVLRMYVPIVFVGASLWGAGNVPTSFQKLGAALLAGYSADSAFRAAVSGLASQSAKKKPSSS